MNLSNSKSRRHYTDSEAAELCRRYPTCITRDDKQALADEFGISLSKLYNFIHRHNTTTRYTDEILLDHVRKAAEGHTRLRSQEYRQYHAAQLRLGIRIPDIRTLRKRIGTWDDVIQAAGLKQIEEAATAELRELAFKLLFEWSDKLLEIKPNRGKTFTAFSDYARSRGLNTKSKENFCKMMGEPSWRELLDNCGIGSKLTRHDLIKALQLFAEHSPCTSNLAYRRFSEQSGFAMPGADRISDTFGGWQNALAAADVEYVSSWDAKRALLSNSA